MQTALISDIGKPIRKLTGFYLKMFEAPFKLWTRDIKVPKELTDITVYNPEEEVSPLSVGMSTYGVSKIWSALEALYRTGLYPAVSFCLRRHGKIVLNRTIGHAQGNGPGDRNMEKVLMTPQTPACIFSCTKAVTAMLVHLLSQQKQLSLLDPVSYYIPEFAQNGKKDISIYQLLGHQAGIPKLPTVAEEELEEVLFDPEEAVRRLCSTPADRPGDHKRYHAVTAGFILGELVRRISGKSLRHFLREHVQEPLGLRYFNYGLESKDSDAAAINYSTGLPLVFPVNFYQKNVLGLTMQQAIDASNSSKFKNIIVPAANIFATAEECSRFFQLMLNGGEYDGVRVFDPLTIRRATVEHGKRETDYTQLIPIRYTAGMMLGGKPLGLFGPNTENAFGHLGITNNLCWADPQRDVSVALLTTGKPVLGFHILPILRLLAQISRYCYPLTQAEQDSIAAARGMIGQINTCW